MIPKRTFLRVVLNRFLIGLLIGMFMLVRCGKKSDSITAPDSPNPPPPPQPGGIVAFTSGRPFWNVYSIHLNGSNEDDLTNSLRLDSSPAFSSDGTLIAYCSDCVSDQFYDIYIMNQNGRDRTRLTYHERPIHTSFGVNRPLHMHPAWSSDNRMIAFHSDIDGDNEIFSINVETGEESQLTENDFEDFDPSVSPDGTMIAFTSDRDGNHEIYIMNVDGTNQRRLTNTDAFDGHAAWSPDSSMIAFSSNRDDKYDLYLMNGDGSNQVRLTNADGFNYDPAWSPDGRFIAFTSQGGGGAQIYVTNLDGSEIFQLTSESNCNITPSWGYRVTTKK